MLIGIDASRAVKDQKTGTEHYSEQIIHHLSKIDKKNDYILYAPNKPSSGLLIKLPKNFKWKIMPFPRLWSQIRLSWELKFGKPKPDVMFEPAHTIPIWYHPKSIVTIHDLGFKYYPELYTPFERFYHNWCMDFSAKHAKHIIAPSEATKKDIIKFYNINSKKITVIYHGYDRKTFSNKNVSHQPSSINKYKPYIFYIGRLEEKKNIQNAIKAYGILRKNPKIHHKFVLAGKHGYNYDKIKSAICNLKSAIKKDVIELGYIGYKDIALWYQNADVFFFPSNFEGFGMPIIEAMACGTPVCASNTTSIPEIGGGAISLFDPKNPQNMAQKLEKIILDNKYKKELIKKGFKKASEFSWEKSAKKHLDVIMKITY